MSQEICMCHVHKTRQPDEKKKLKNRLHRMEGQLRGIARMVEEDAYCPAILGQVAAVRAALGAFEREMLLRHIHTCVADDARAGKAETVEELERLLAQLMK